MTSLEQLATLRRQVEEDYKLDMAAIDRLQRRFNEAIANGSKVVTTSVEPQPTIEPRSVTLVPAGDLRPQPPDQLTESLRTMFSNYR
jgi:hypothetical protein